MWPRKTTDRLVLSCCPRFWSPIGLKWSDRDSRNHMTKGWQSCHMIEIGKIGSTTHKCGQTQTIGLSLGCSTVKNNIYWNYIQYRSMFQPKKMHVGPVHIGQCVMHACPPAEDRARPSLMWWLWWWWGSQRAIAYMAPLIRVLKRKRPWDH